MAESGEAGSEPAGLLRDEDGLLKQWAPTLYLHPEEKYFPSSVEWYLERVSLKDGAGTVVYKPVIAPPQRRDGSVLADPSPGERRDWTLNILDRTSRAGNLKTASCYGYVRAVTDPQNGELLAQDLNYWFFYPFNGNSFDRDLLLGYLATAVVVSGPLLLIPALGPYVAVTLLGWTLTQVIAWVKTWDGVEMHQGDWETITVRVDPDGREIQKIYFAGHGQGSWETKFDTTPDGRPKVYVAKESHAAYATTGDHRRLAGLANDPTSEGGVAWDTRPVVIDVGYDRDVSLAVLWNGTDGVAFDNGDDPSIAINTDREVVSVHKPSPGDSRLFYNAGTVVIDEVTNQPRIQWWKGGKGTEFDSGKNPSRPAVAVNDGGLIVSVHHGLNNRMYYNLGAMDPFAEEVHWWNAFQGTFFGEGTVPAVALNNQNTVVVSGLDGQRSWILYTVGKVNLETKAIDWKQGERFSNHGDDVIPAVALSDRGDVVEVQSRSGALYVSLGWVDTSQAITWAFRHRSFSTGDRPAVAINRDGFVLVVASSKGQRHYAAGQVLVGDDSHPRDIEWFAKARPYGTGQGGQSVALTSDGVVVEAEQSGGRLSWNAGRALVEARSARDTQRWLQYSGRWGRKGDKPRIAFLGLELAQVTSGPEGPAFKDSWIAGPDA